MVRKVFIIIGLVLLVLVISEVIGLVILHRNIGRFAEYWKQRSQATGQFVYVALGDSAAQGVGASRPELSYVGLLADQIEQQAGKRVRVVNLSVTGATVEDLLHDQLPKLAQYNPDLITVEIGANDMRTYNKEVFEASYRQLLRALPEKPIVLANIPFFGGRDATSRNADNANKVVEAVAKQHQLPVVDLFSALRDRQSPFIYAADFFHPNNRGYRIWYEVFQPTVEQAISNRYSQTIVP